MVRSQAQTQIFSFLIFVNFPNQEHLNFVLKLQSAFSRNGIFPCFCLKESEQANEMMKKKGFRSASDCSTLMYVSSFITKTATTITTAIRICLAEQKVSGFGFRSETSFASFFFIVVGAAVAAVVCVCLLIRLLARLLSRPPAQNQNYNKPNALR